MFKRAVVRYSIHLTDNVDLQDDLVQEAMILLWELDITRFDLSERRDLQYVRRSLVRRMRRVWQRESERSVSTNWAVTYELGKEIQRDQQIIGESE